MDKDERIERASFRFMTWHLVEDKVLMVCWRKWTGSVIRLEGGGGSGGNR